MDKAELIAKVAQDGEDRLLLARILDKYQQSQRRNIPVSTEFLSPREQAMAEAVLRTAGVRSGYAFDGGYEAAERKILRFLPDWAEGEQGELAFLRADFHGPDSALTHRDILGSLMGLGVARERVGDILVGEKAAQLVCLRDAAPIILSQFDQAGRYRLKLREIPLGELAPAPAEVKLIHDTVSTLRLDAVLSSGFSLARGKAADAVTGGRVSLNHRECLKPDRAVAQGDVITCRGLGKCVLKTVGGQSRKGRIIIEIERYL